MDEFLKAAKVKGITTGEALLHQLEDKTKRKDLLAKLETNVARLASHKQRIDKLAKKTVSVQVAARVAPMLDIKTLRGQFKTFKKATAKNGSTKEELAVLLRLHKETTTAADRIETRLHKIMCEAAESLREMGGDGVRGAQSLAALRNRPAGRHAHRCAAGRRPRELASVQLRLLHRLHRDDVDRCPAAGRRQEGAGDPRDRDG